MFLASINTYFEISYRENRYRCISQEQSVEDPLLITNCCFVDNNKKLNKQINKYNVTKEVTDGRQNMYLK